MNVAKEFPVILKHKIPYFSPVLLWGIGIAAFALFLLYVVMYPTKYSSDEMAVAYYILFVPEWLKNISAIASGSIIIFAVIYFRAKLHKPALLIIYSNVISIKRKQINHAIQSKDITRVFCNDLTDIFRHSKYKMQIGIRSKYRKLIVFQLQNYDDADDVLTTLYSVTAAEFTFLEISMLSEFDD